jgi:hypothetical protein
VHDALKRRCLYHWISHPDFDRELAILRVRAPEVSERLAREVAAMVESLRGLELYKPPGVAETIDWAHALAALDAASVDEHTVDVTLGTILKYREDQERTRAHGLDQLVHAALERIGDDWTVVDDGLSHNGTHLNGSRVTSRQRLKDGDVLTIGGVALAFRAPGGESMSRPTVTAMGPHVGELLTPAQRRVLIALCRPFKDSTYATPATNQQIADELVVSVDAVKSTLRALFEVFGVDALPQNQKRASLALQAMRTGVITRRDL